MKKEKHLPELEPIPAQSTPFTHEEFYRRYYVHRVAAGAVVINKVDKILLVKEVRRGKYVWSIPGGLLEKGEPLIHGVKREVQEETGAEINPFCLLGLTNWAGNSIFKDDPYNQVGLSIVLGANYVTGEIRPDEEEVTECHFFSIKEIQELGSATYLTNIITYFNAIKNENYIPLSKTKYVDELTYNYVFSPK